MLFREYINEIVKKSVNTINYHSSKFYFLKFFFERNNKQKNLEIKKNYIFSNSKWTNYYTSSLNINQIFIYLKYILLTSLTLYFFYVCFYLQHSFFAYTYYCYLIVYHVLERVALLLFISYNTLNYLITGQKYDVKEIIEKIEQEVKAAEAAEKAAKLKEQREAPVTRADIYGIILEYKIHLLLQVRKTYSLTLEDFAQITKRAKVKPKKMKTLTELEFENLSNFNWESKLFSSLESKLTTYKLNFLTLNNLNFNLNNLNFKNVLNLAKEDRWLIKSSLIDNNALLKLNLYNNYYNNFNTFFTSNAWLLKKHYFYNQLKNNNYNVSTYITTEKVNNFKSLPFNFFNLNLKYTLSDLNSLYIKPNKKKLNLNNLNSISNNVDITPNNLDLFLEENLFFFSKITSNMTLNNNISFYSTQKPNIKVQNTVKFKK